MLLVDQTIDTGLSSELVVVLTLTVTQSENGIVTSTKKNEKMVRSIAQTPGPSGSAEK